MSLLKNFILSIQIPTLNSNGQQEITYAPVQPDFEWEDNGDFPSGIEKWHIFYRPSGTNDVRHYRTYDSDSVNYNEYGHIQMRDTNFLLWRTVFMIGGWKLKTEQI